MIQNFFIRHKDGSVTRIPITWDMRVRMGLFCEMIHQSIIASWAIENLDITLPPVNVDEEIYRNPRGMLTVALGLDF